MNADDLALTGGEWRAVRGVAVWVPCERGDEPTLQLVPAPPRPPDLTKLIACPTCHAKVTEVCRTRNGVRTGKPHASRLAPRLCPCGEVPGRGRVFCEACYRENDRQAKRNYKARLRREAS